MSDHVPGQPADPHPEHREPLQVPGEVVERSQLADRRPDVDRLRAVRTGESSAVLYVDWPESPETKSLAPQVFERARAFAQATRRAERLLETVPVELEVHVRARSWKGRA